MIDVNNDQQLRQIIVDHYTKPQFKAFINDENYVTKSVSSNTCADELTIQFLLLNNVIIDARFTGSACAIACASADIFMGLVINKEIDFVNNLSQIYYDFLNNGNLKNQLILDELVVFKNIYKQRNRISCASLFLPVFTEII